jgi:transposase InsO family protein
VYAVIAQLEQAGFAVARLCQVLDVHRALYYGWRAGSFSRRAAEDCELKPIVQDIFWEHRRRYGARRISRELAGRGRRCGVQRVGRLLRELELKAIQPKSYRPRTTDSRHRLGFSPNLLIDSPPPTAVNQVWVGDISYIPLHGGGYLYLALLLDRYSRRIVGWDLRDHMKEPLVVAVLRQAITQRRPAANLIHHTDRGGQYAGHAYRQMLARARMRQSMSRATNVYDNAFMESCLGTIKTELEMKCYENELAARTEIGSYIRYYNTRRRHSSVDYHTPEQFETAGMNRSQKPASKKTT